MNLCVEFIKQTVPEQLNMEKEGKVKAMKDECRKGVLEMKLKIVECSQIFQGVPPLYESGPKGQDQIIESLVFTMEKDGWRLEDQDGKYYTFRKEGNL